MDDTADPLHQFFTPSQATQQHILYITLTLPSTATPEEIRKSYRKLSLKYHPDKQFSKSDKEKETLGKEFQRVGFAYAVLSDEGRRKRYDKTGRTDESAFTEAESMGWEAYFESLYQRVDRKMLDEDKLKYQGSAEETEDIISSYNRYSGSFPNIIDSIPHSTHTDEPRITQLINQLISDSRLEATPKWKTTSTDVKGREKRAKAADREAKRAEASAKELGVWDEFYGGGKKGKRKSGGAQAADGEEGLKALILKRQKDREGGLKGMEEKYRKMQEEEKARKKTKRGKGKVKDEEVDELAGDDEDVPELDDAAFEALQAKMFGDKKNGGGKDGKKAKAKGK